MKKSAFLALAAALCVAGVAGLYLARTAGDPAGTAAVAAGARSAAAPSAAFVVHFDPATGKVVEPSPSAAPVTFGPEWRNSLSTSADGLVEERSPIPGGGVMVDLRGRFRSAMVAVTDGEGHVTAPCVSDPEAARGGDGR